MSSIVPTGIRRYLFIAALPFNVCAAGNEGIHFSHNDWEIACDNTRTCRAAGYQNDQDQEDDLFAVSVLLTRKAGPDQPVTGSVMIGNYGDEAPAPLSMRLMMRVNGRDLGSVNLDKRKYSAHLSDKQIAAMLAVLPRHAEIEWSDGQNSWRISDAGAAAVLLKMDEIQGRIGTRSALIRKGSRDEAEVLPALPRPVVFAASLAKPKPGDGRLVGKELRSALKKTVDGDVCSELFDQTLEKDKFEVVRLTDSRILVSKLCWRGAYNDGLAFWIVNDKAPYNPELVTKDGSAFASGRITAEQKGRGLGDCWSSDTWSWDGVRFVHTQSNTTGMCKLVVPGGAWDLPTLVTDVRPAHR